MTRVITPESGIPQKLAPMQLLHWLPGMGSAPTVMQAPPEVEKTSMQPEEATMFTAARKLTYSIGSQKKTMAEAVKGNKTQTQGMQLKFYPPMVKDGVKTAKLNTKEIELQVQKWKTALIGYVLGGNLSFKEMLKFVYGVWNFVTTPTVIMHDDGYFIFKFESMEDKERVMQQGPYTANNRPMILKDWDRNFQIKEESMRIVPLWVNFPGLPIQCWTEENLGRIASLLGKPVCTDKLTAECERISYARVLVDMDITQPLPEEVHIEILGQKSWIQMVEFEWKPKFCLECNNFGHDKAKCQQMEEQKKKSNRKEEERRGK
ncbi:PREDICTED: uncharacterized protein LOC109237704 [Nicotiana attenuata]|uniref:uncharacterized protein LOC109237704 n=1 Tax=Nicotiana attenuata TaxID=49451 RepID=UPI000904D1F9|nr:PREDICTED: uncharacterized protein LOC109237704 [Nicotiana attenuata]